MYLKAPYFNGIFQLFEITLFIITKITYLNLYIILFQNLCSYLEIETKIIKSSNFGYFDHTLKGREK